MSSDPFPERVDVVKLFARNGSISAELPLARLPRLTAYLANTAGVVEVELEFGHDDEGRRLLNGTLDTQVNVVCQRCLQEMKLDLHSGLRLLVFESEGALRELPDTDDAVAMEEGALDLPGLIEDELILSLPLVPVHADPSCNRVLNALRQEADAKEQEGKQSPFAVLADYKVKTDK